MDGSEASVGLNGDYFAYGNYLVGGASCMGKRARRGGRSELAREIRAGVRDSLCQAARDQPGRPVPTQGPEARRERARPSVAPGYQSPASAAAAADAEFPEDWPRAESPEVVADTAASPEVDAAIAAAPWRRAAGPQAKRAAPNAAEPPPEGRAAEDPPAAGAAAGGSSAAEDAESSGVESEHGEDSEPIGYLTDLEYAIERARDVGDQVAAARLEELAAEERACPAGWPTQPRRPQAAKHEVSLSSEGELSTPTPRASSRSRSRSPDTPEAYREFDRADREFDREFELLEICSLEYGGTGSSSGGAAPNYDGTASGSGGRTGSSAARGRGRGRRPPWVRPWKADRGSR